MTPDDAHYGTTMQPHANHFVIRVNNRSRAFLAHYETLAADFHLISDEPSKAPNSSCFQAVWQ